MSILDRLNLLVRSEFNAASNARGPSRAELRQTLRDASESLAQIRTNEREVHREYQLALDALDAAEDRAVAALGRGDEAAAKHALRQKEVLDQRAKTLREQLDSHRSQLGDLRAALRALEHRAAASRERREAEERGRRERSGGYAAAPLPSLDAGGVLDDSLDKLAELESRIDSMEAEFSADASLSDDPLFDRETARVDDEFKKLSARTRLNAARGTESALDRLRKAMNEDTDD